MIEEKRFKLTGDGNLSETDEKGIRRFGNRIWIPNLTELKQDILSKFHEVRYLIHPESTKI